ncbi:DNA-processing protein DprA [Hippea jasoniae]|uniref:DNA-processing protein DprA n=1 Tax=Hippea jasoniae TaxID=944479 RepID=UPI00068C9FF1|nr:DNA-processing protein DprA [Hippea jasoniae]
MHTNELKILLSGINIKDPSRFESLDELYFEVKDKIKKRDVSKELEYVEKNSIKLISFFDDDYPERLRQMDYPPVVLYVKGKLKELSMPLAVVGSRHPSGYGQKALKHILPPIVEAGFEIISGLAMGIDALAHKIAIGGGGYTIGVLGCGIDIVYPYSNKALFELMPQKGCIISEFPLSTPPNRYNFPRRNRIIAGLSDAVFVVEAELKSGSLITARIAAEQGKTVFALPGDIFSKRSEGTNRLIYDGATIVIDRYTIPSHFYVELKKEIGQYSDYATPELEEKEKLVYEAMDAEMDENEIALKTQLTIQEVAEIIFDLSLKGLVKKTPSGYIRQ